MPDQLDHVHEIAEPIRRAVIVLAIRVFFTLYLIDTIYAFLLLASVAGYIPAEWTGSYVLFLWIIYTIKFIVLAYAIVKQVIDWFGTVYYVREGHLIRQRGLLHITERLFQLTDIESVTMDQSWLGKMLNYGHINIVFSIARQREELTLYAINSPERYKKFFSDFV